MRTWGRPNNVPSRNPPLFSPGIWSVSNRVRLELPRTTNTAESWHRKLNRLTSPHPGKNYIFIFLFHKYFILYILFRASQMYYNRAKNSR